MADEANQTDVTNLAEASPTDANAATASGSSTTDQPTGDAAAGGADAAAGGDAGGDADPLDGGSLLGDDAKPSEGEAAKEGEGAEGGKGGEGDDGKGDEPALTGAPEGDYDLTGALPEGTVLDSEALAKIAPTAKALNLSNAGLARIASEGLPIVQKQVSDGIIADVVAQRAGWDADTRAAVSGGKNAAGDTVAADPIYSGKSFDDVTSAAGRAIDRFAGDALFPAAKADGTPGTFRDFLKTTGLGNHPAMMRFAFQAGTLISEDTSFERGGGVPNTPKTREEKYYAT